MLSVLRQVTMAVVTITILFVTTSNGQVETNNAKKSVARVGIPAGSPNSEPPSRKRSAGPKVKLPFEQSVIVYYNASTSRPTDLNTRKEKATGSSPSTQMRKAPPGQIASRLQPIVILYKTYQRDTVTVKREEAAVEEGFRTVTPKNAVSREGGGPDTILPITSSSGSEPFAGTPRPLSGDNDVAALPNAAVEPKASAEPASFGTRSTRAFPIDPVSVAAKDNTESKLVASPEPLGSTIYLRENAQVRGKTTDTSLELAVAPAVANQASSPVDLTAPIFSPPPASGEISSDAAADAVELNNTAVGLTMEHQYAEARSLLERAIHSEPNLGRLHRNLSIVYERMKMLEEALASARTAEKLSPLEPSIVEQRCALELETDNARAALGCYEKLNSMKPLDGLAQAFFGIALFRSGKVGESIIVLEKAANSTPSTPVAMNALGMVYFNTNRIKDAAAAFKRAVEIAPDMYESRYNLAIAQLSLRNKAAAISQYNILKVDAPELAARLYSVMFSDKIVIVPKN